MCQLGIDHWMGTIGDYYLWILLIFKRGWYPVQSDILCPWVIWFFLIDVTKYALVTIYYFFNICARCYSKSTTILSEEFIVKVKWYAACTFELGLEVVINVINEVLWIKCYPYKIININSNILSNITRTSLPDIRLYFTRFKTHVIEVIRYFHAIFSLVLRPYITLWMSVRHCNVPNTLPTIMLKHTRLWLQGMHYQYQWSKYQVGQVQQEITWYKYIIVIQLQSKNYQHVCHWGCH